MNATYERGITKLIAIVRRLNKPHSPTQHRKKIEAIAQQLEEVADVLATGGAAQFAIERLHDESGKPLKRTGVDGYMITEPADPDFQSYGRIRWQLRILADSARKAALELRDPRQKPALPFAARGLLHLRHDYDFPPPKFSNDSPDVIELDRVCSAAGIVLSRERLRGALASVWKKFDPQYKPPGYGALYK